MALGRQAKTLSRHQVDAIFLHVGSARNGTRNQLILLLSVRAGLRAKEIASLKWYMVLDANGEIGDHIYLTDKASKGKSGRVIPINTHLKSLLEKHFEQRTENPIFFSPDDYVIQTERSMRTSPQAIVNMFQKWYRELGFVGCSSHSGRRTFITNAARKISTVGGSLRDIQFLAGHSSLQTTQRYIEGDSEARNKVVNLI